MTGSADDGREDSTWCVISGETSLAHTRAVVDNQRCYIIVTHLVGLVFLTCNKKISIVLEVRAENKNENAEHRVR